MTQTLAIFHEAYRSLNSKKLFWIVLVLSGLVVAAFGCVGVNDRGLKVLFWQFDMESFNTRLMSAGTLYKFIFVQIGIGVWLSWLGTILALISTAGIFPDLITSGSIDLFVSKPISRLRLFATEYVAGLLFVTLQVTIFSLASFLVIGLRGGAWEPGLFVAIPIEVCFFSYLFAICVFLGVLTRSTVAALLLTLLFWFFVFSVGSAESTVLMFKTMHDQGVTLDGGRPESGERGPVVRSSDDFNIEMEGPVADNKPADDSHVLDTAHKILYGVKTLLPKTSETIALLQRSLIDLAELPKTPASGNNPRDQQMQNVQKELVETLRARSIAWVVGTSLGFELFVLACAALVFCRRDY